MRWFPEWYTGERNRYINRRDKEEEVFASFAPARATARHCA